VNLLTGTAGNQKDDNPENSQGQQPLHSLFPFRYTARGQATLCRARYFFLGLLSNLQQLSQDATARTIQKFNTCCPVLRVGSNGVRPLAARMRTGDEGKTWVLTGDWDWWWGKHLIRENFMKKIAARLLFFLLLPLTGCGAGLIHKADSSFDEGNYHNSLELYAEYLEKHPEAFLARRKYGLALLKDNLPGEAVVQFKKVIDHHPRDSWSLLHIGLAYLLVGDYQETLSAWQHYEAGGKPRVAEEVARQSQRIAAALPEVSNELVSEIEAAIEDAIWAHQLQSKYNAARLERCGGG
jgi:tetratricopeptide (TPR) repeat protein